MSQIFDIVEELETINYITSKGEDVELHFYLCIDDGKTDKKIAEEDKEETIWVQLDEVESKVTFDNLKRFWNNSKIKVLGRNRFGSRRLGDSLSRRNSAG